MGMETGIKGLRLSSSWMSQAMRSCSLHSEYAPTSRCLWHPSLRGVGSAVACVYACSQCLLLHLVPLAHSTCR